MAAELKTDDLALAADDADRDARIESGLPSAREAELATAELPAGSVVKYVGWVKQLKDGSKDGGARLLVLTDTCFFTFKKKSKVVKK